MKRKTKFIVTIYNLQKFLDKDGTNKGLKLQLITKTQEKRMRNSVVKHEWTTIKECLKNKALISVMILQQDL